MKFIYVVRTELHLYPPCLNQINYLRELGYDVLAIYGDCNEKTEMFLNEKNVKTINFSIKRSKVRCFGKIQSYIKYRNNVLKALAENYQKGDFVWYGTADSCFSLGNECNRYPFILNVLELYDDNAFYRNGIGKVIKSASAIVACEPTRADIMKMWWGLAKRPYVMPNKPYSLPLSDERGSIEETHRIIDQIKEKIIFLYQGILASDRNLGFLADALQILNNKSVYLALMGKEISDCVNDLKRKYPQTIYLGYVPAPYHLEVTAKAFVGIAYYQGLSLNNLFCAPNKIYEYSGLGLPILCNDIPGLRNTVGIYHAGECVDFENQTELIDAIQRIISNRKSYAQNSLKLYNSVDNKKTMLSILSDIFTQEMY